MGQIATKEQKLHTETLQVLPDDQGFRLQTSQLVTLLLWVRNNCPWFPATGYVLEELIVTWSLVYVAIRSLGPAGDILQTAAAAPPCPTTDRSVVSQDDSSLKLSQEETEHDEVLDPQGAPPEDDLLLNDPSDMGSVDPEQDFDLDPPLTPVNAIPNATPTVREILQCQHRGKFCSISMGEGTPPLAPTAPPFTPSPYRSDWQVKEKVQCLPLLTSTGLLDKCRVEALKKGDVELLQAMPVICRPDAPPQFEHLPYELIKEVHKSIKDYGLHTSFTMILFQAIGDSYTMTPADWKSILRLVLSATQYSVRLTQLTELVNLQALDNMTAGINVGQNELLGEGPYATSQAQAGLHQVVFQKLTELAMKELRRVPDLGTGEASFASIWQEAHEPYMRFLDPLQTAVQRQVENPAAADVLLFQLAIENATADCQQAIDPIKNQAKTIADLIKACQNVGSEHCKAEILAAALAQQMVMARAAVKCFSCRQEGHIKKIVLKIEIKAKREFRLNSAHVVIRDITG
ncbi:PREDICTED: endogenous retrovirus group K member 5 Gag polyprotein-like [Tauraco erythrolophus]|uniref:endogenous retrovirus group K member 5 Gag polyprotein-like n=1 Tax=Tauraco erythrolophus TaxID=121530 RepID=UPI0005233DED|nr:PREDICTED: endogenous retrovirus group K member 5 Gag polyprotein-like [Tauraco erythrolophus]